MLSNTCGLVILIRTYLLYRQWIRIRIDLVFLDPDPHWECGSVYFSCKNTTFCGFKVWPGSALTRISVVPLYPDPDPHLDKELDPDPDPYWNVSGSTTFCLFWYDRLFRLFLLPRAGVWWCRRTSPPPPPTATGATRSAAQAFPPGAHSGPSTSFFSGNPRGGREVKEDDNWLREPDQRERRKWSALIGVPSWLRRFCFETNFSSKRNGIRFAFFSSAWAK